jgi:phage-related protein
MFYNLNLDNYNKRENYNYKYLFRHHIKLKNYVNLDKVVINMLLKYHKQLTLSVFANNGVSINYRLSFFKGILLFDILMVFDAFLFAFRDKY